MDDTWICILWSAIHFPCSAMRDNDQFVIELIWALPNVSPPARDRRHIDQAFGNEALVILESSVRMENFIHNSNHERHSSFQPRWDRKPSRCDRPGSFIESLHFIKDVT
jgi:hypothetical protein